MRMGQWEFGGEKERKEILGEMLGVMCEVHSGGEATSGAATFVC